MISPAGIDRYDDCRQCHGHYRYFTKAAFEICDECGHKRRYTNQTPWWDQAACKGVNPDMFHPQRGQSPSPAKRICETCPVLNTCRSYALSVGERIGVWGGLTAKERRFMRAIGGIIDRVCEECGVPFDGHGTAGARRLYCDDCSTPEAAKARRASAREARIRNAS